LGTGPPSPSGRFARFAPLVPWLPLIVGALVFVPAAIGAGMVADDAVNLATHANHGDLIGEWTTPTYRHAGAGRGHIWRPIPATLQHLAAIAFGRSGTVFRLLNVALHLVNTALVMLLARRLGASALGGVALAVCFTLHPVVPDAVGWSSDVYDLAATTVTLGILGVGLGEGKTTWRIVGVGVLTLVGALCKESAVAVVPVIAVAALLLGRGWKRAAGVAASSGVAAAAYFALHHAITAQGYADAAGQTPLLHQVQAGMAAVGWLLAPPARAPMAHLFNPTEFGEPLMGLAVLAGLLGASAFFWRRAPQAARALLAATVAWCLLLGPAAVGTPMIGVQPVRYAYLPLAAFTVLVGGAGALWPRAQLGLWFAGLWVLLAAPRAVVRVHDFEHDGALWSAELQVEPTNPYAAGSLARWLLKEGREAEALPLWAGAVDAAPRGLRVFDRHNERWLLAQAAFLRGAPQLAHQQVSTLIEEMEAEGKTPPDMAWCLLADSLDALGRSDEASTAAALCRP
jgi:hypothetical protein